jgi:hypothetical protein
MLTYAETFRQSNLKVMGHSLECIHCRLRLEFPAGANHDAIAKLFEFYPCSVAPPPKPDDSSD